MRSSMLKVEKSGNKILAKKPSGTNFILLLTYEILPKYKKNLKRLTVSQYFPTTDDTAHWVTLCLTETKVWDLSMRLKVQSET